MNYKQKNSIYLFNNACRTPRFGQILIYSTTPIFI